MDFVHFVSRRTIAEHSTVLMEESMTNTIPFEPGRLFQYLKILDWGPPGSGKSRFASTIIDSVNGEKGFVFDFDGRPAQYQIHQGWECYFLRETEYADPKQYVRAKIKLEGLERLNPFNGVVFPDPLTDEAKEDMLRRWNAMPFPYKAVVLDSLTFFGKATLDYCSASSQHPIPAQSDYMTQMTYIEQFISRLNALPCIVAVTAHEESASDMVTGQLFKNIAITGKLSGRIPGYFDEMYHHRSEIGEGGEPEFHIRTRADSIHGARTAIPTLGTTIDNDWRVIREAIERFHAPA